MLPDFVQIKKEIAGHFNKVLKATIEKADPLLSQIKRSIVHEGNLFQTEPQEGVVIATPYEHISTTISQEVAEIIEKGIVVFYEKIPEIVDSMSKQEGKFFFKRLGEITDLTGRVVHTNEGSISQETYLQMIDSVEIGFDDKGRITSTMVVSPNTAASLSEKLLEWNKDPEFVQKYKDLIDKKHREHCDRENNRKLVD